MSSKKISEFISQSSLADTDNFDFIRNGYNYRVSFDTMKSSLGALGNITSVGNGSPVLDSTGTNYQIRTIESGNGVNVALSAFNGLKISTSFTSDDGGVQLVDSFDQATPKFRSLVAGNGINIGVSGDEIQISEVGAVQSSKTVLVSNIDDFPSPVSGVITLEDSTDYLLIDDVSTANRFVVGSMTSVRAASSQIIDFEYTGTGVFFTGVDPNFRIDRITLNCPNGTLVDMTSPGGSSEGIFQIIESNVETMLNGGNFEDMFIVRLDAVAFEGIVNSGFTFSGNHQNIVLFTGVQFMLNGSFLDFSGATMNTVTIENQVFTGAVGTPTFIKGDAASANINVGGLGVVANNRIFGTATTLDTISVDDIRWNFTLNDEIPDTRPDAMLCLESNATESVISTIDTPVLIGGTWTAERASQFTDTAAGRATYNGERPAILPVTLSATVLAAAGGDKQYSTYIAVNGAVVTCTKVQDTLSSTKAGTMTNLWQLEFQPGDYIEAFVENNSSTDNAIVTNAILRID